MSNPNIPLGTRAAGELQAATLVAIYGYAPVGSAMEVMEWRKAMRLVLPEKPTAVLAAWLGGAPPKEGQSPFDKRRNAIDVVIKTNGLTGPIPSVAWSLAKLKKRATYLGSIVEVKGGKKQIKAAKSQQENVEQAIGKLKTKLTIGAGIGGLGLAIAGGIALLILIKR